MVTKMKTKTKMKMKTKMVTMMGRLVLMTMMMSMREMSLLKVTVIMIQTVVCLYSFCFLETNILIACDIDEVSPSEDERRAEDFLKKASESSRHIIHTPVRKF